MGTERVFCGDERREVFVAWGGESFLFSMVFTDLLRLSG